MREAHELKAPVKTTNRGGYLAECRCGRVFLAPSESALAVSYTIHRNTVGSTERVKKS